MAQVKAVRVQDRQYITVKRVVQQVKTNAVYMRHLPDHPAVAGRAFLFNIVNTLDPHYFKRAQGELERHRLAKGAKGKESCVEVCPEMAAILGEYTALSAGRTANAQSLAMLKMGAKKRQKTERQPVPELTVRITQLK